MGRFDLFLQHFNFKPISKLNYNEVQKKESPKNEQNIFSKVLNYLPKIFLIFSISWIGLSALLSYKHSFDYAYYHLPIALTHFRATTYMISGFVEALAQGLPPFFNLARGLLVSVFSQKLGTSFNFLFFLVFLAVTSWGLKLTHSRTVFTTALMAIPLLVLQFHSGFIDASCGMLLAVSFFAFSEITRFGWTNRRFAYLVGSLCLSMLAKFQMWPVVGVLVASYSCWAFYHLEKKRALVSVFILLVFNCPWPLRNIYYFKNPTFPFPTPIFSDFQGDQKDLYDLKFVQAAQLYEGYQDLAKPFVFLISVFELSRLHAPTHLDWNDNAWVEGEIKNPHFRIGGWSPLFVLLVLASIFILIKLKKAEWKWSLGTWGLVVLVISFIQQCHELRYWLVIPIVGAHFIASAWQFLEQNSFRKKLVWLRWPLVIAFLISTGRAWPTNIEAKLPEDFAPAEAKSFWQSKEALLASRDNPACVYDRSDWVIYYSGPDFNTYWIKHCGQKK